MKKSASATAGVLASRKVPALIVATAALLIAGCGSSSKSTTSTTAPASSAATTAGSPAPVNEGAGSSLSLTADKEGQLKYNTSTLTAKAGKISIAFSNSSPLAHNVTVEGAGQVRGATPTFSGGTQTLTVNLKPGTYKFYCSVPGHRQAGMEGTLTVH